MSLDLIPIKNNILQEVRFNEVKQIIIARIHELKLIENRFLKDPEWVSYVMNIIENIVQKKDKIDKRELIFSVAKEVLGASPSDLDALEKTMNFLLSNKAIKKVSYYKIFKCGVVEWFSKRLGLKS
jgi:hypothetical protein